MSEENKEKDVEGQGTGDQTKTGDDKDQSTGDKSNEGANKEPEKTFTQEQVNKMMAKEKNQGRNSVLSDLGIDPKDKAAIAALKTLIESQKTDEQKKNDEAAAEQKRIAELENKAMIAEIKAESLMLNVQPQYADDVVTLALSKMSSSPDAELTDILGEFKTKYPAWFKEEESKENEGQRGTGSNIGAGDKGKKSKDDGIGKRLAAKRTASAPKKSYWG
jgi:hypothetical protein